jgi:hypothetical protein
LVGNATRAITVGEEPRWIFHSSMTEEREISEDQLAILK